RPCTAEATTAHITSSHGDRELVVSVPANEGEWWVLYREPASTAFAVARTTQLTIWLGALLVAVVAVGALFWLSHRLGRLVTEPVLAAGAVARRVAGGALSVAVATHRTAATDGAAHDAARLLQSAGKLAQGAEEAARRNADLSALARRHKEGLDQSTARLAKLADEVAKGAEEAEALTQASARIQTFVAQTKAVAT